MLVRLPRDKLVRLELFEDSGGKALLAKIAGLDAKAPVKPADALRALPKSPRFEIIVWLLPPVGKGETREFDAVLAAPPLAVPD